MHPLIYIGIVLILLLLFCIFYGGKDTKTQKFIGLNYLDPTKDEFEQLVDAWGFPLKDIEGNELDSLWEKIPSETDIPSEIDITPDFPGDLTIHKEFNESIRLEDYQTNSKKFCSNGEKICRMTLEKIYDATFLNKRLDCLKNPKTGANLEIDCYNDIYKIGVEYNGEHHYKYPNRFHKNIDEFMNQLERDQLKKDLCSENGIHLIVVPYNIPNSLIPSYILQNLPEGFDEE